MKGLEVWMWLIAGVIVGMIMFALFFQLMSYLTLSKERENARESFGGLVNEINAMCESRPGAQATEKFVFPGSVSIVYSTSDLKAYSEIKNRTYGNYACMKFRTEQICEKLRCDLEFAPVKNKETVIGIVDILLSKSTYQEHTVQLTKTECGMSALKQGHVPSLICGGVCKLVPLIECQDSIVYGLASPQLLILTDMAMIDNCCSGGDKIITLLQNAATYFGGSKILLVWERDTQDPASGTRQQIINSLSSSGFTIIAGRHNLQLTTKVLKDYDQLWLFFPGWCIIPSLQGCGDWIPWTDSEVDAIGNFVVNGGKVFLFTDTSGGDPTIQNVVNKILTEVKSDVTVNGTSVCGASGQIITVTPKKHQLTTGLNSFDISVATGMQC
ncbi:MAG: hypothetical protein V1944_00370 [Candidatus Aenigmatarchaeota archaeon]